MFAEVLTDDLEKIKSVVVAVLSFYVMLADRVWLLLLLSLHLQFADQFKEVKEAARLAREKSQERFELANPALNIAAPQVTHCSIFVKSLLRLPT